MSDADQAAAIVAHYNSTNASIRNTRVYIQFSTRAEISLPPSQASFAPTSINSGSNVSDKKVSSAQSPPNSILIVTVTNTRNLDVTLDNIHQTFKMCGTVLKIVIFVTKNGTFKALVHMGSVDEATHAMNNLDSREMFSNCCTLRIGYSNLSELKFKSNGPTSWDFTVTQYQPPYQHSYAAAPSQPAYMIPQQHSLPSFSYDSKIVPPIDLMYQDLAHSGAYVLLVNNLSPIESTPDGLFNLFGVYGDVLRVKLLFNKRDTALIQFSAPHQAHQAYLHLNHLSLHGQELAISFSKHRSVAMPRDQAESNLTKNFTDSPFHRFRSRDGRSPRRVYIHPPSKVLHVSNIFDEATEEDLGKIFGPESVVQFFVDSRRMAYVCFPTIHDSVLALMKNHNHRLGSRCIRVSFSAKSSLSFPEKQEAS